MLIKLYLIQTYSLQMEKTSLPRLSWPNNTLQPTNEQNMHTVQFWWRCTVRCFLYVTETPNCVLIIYMRASELILPPRAVPTVHIGLLDYQTIFKKYLCFGWLNKNLTKLDEKMETRNITPVYHSNNQCYYFDRKTMRLVIYQTYAKKSPRQKRTLR